MKRLIIVLLLLSLVVTSCAPAYRFMLGSYLIGDVESTDIFVIDLTTGSLFTYSDNDDPIVYPASTTKLLGILVALETLPADTIITPGNEINLIGRLSIFNRRKNRWRR